MSWNEITQNRGVRLTVLTIAIAILLFMVLRLLLMLIDVTSDDLSNGSVIFVSVLASGLLVYKYLAGRIA